MKVRKFLLGLVGGVALGFPWLALDYFAWQVWNQPFAPFVLFGWIVRILPGGVVTAMVETMVGTLQQLAVGDSSELGKTIEGIMAWLLVLGIMGVLGALYGLLKTRFDAQKWISGAALGIILWVIFLPAAYSDGWSFQTYGWTLLISLGWGIAVAWLLAALLPSTVETTAGQVETAAAPPVSHRRALASIGIGAVALTLAGLGLGRLLGRDRGLPTAVGDTAASLEPPPTPSSPEQFEPVANTRPNLTPLDDFYRVDINLAPPEIDAETWSLRVSGLVDNPLELSYQELTAMPHENFYATLECISNQIGGDLISTTWFTGVPLRDVLDRVGVQPQTVDIKFTSTDGYTESLPLESARDPETRLCFAMGGEPLQTKHGFPLRLYTPNRFGMKNPKWITQIEAVDEDYRGFWEQRGWSEQAFVQTTSVINTTNMGHGSALAVGGIAYAARRGIQKVEVRLDDGAWQEAQLDNPLSQLTWVLWRADLSPVPEVIN